MSGKRARSTFGLGPSAPGGTGIAARSATPQHRHRARRVRVRCAWWLAPIGGGVEEISPPEPILSHAEQIRALGFDPVYLTPDEQVEVLEMHLLCPDEALSV